MRSLKKHNLSILIAAILFCFQPEIFAAPGTQEIPTNYLVTFKTSNEFRSLRDKLSNDLLLQLLELENLKQQQNILGSEIKITANLWLAQSSVVQISKAQADELSKHPNIKRISPLRKKINLLSSNAADDYTYGLQKVKIPEVRGRYWGLDGRTVKVGIIDTGIAFDHSEFRDKVIVSKDFTKGSKGLATDDHGHGSHVAGTIAGLDFSNKFIGVAPKVDLFIAKGFDSQGNSTDAGLLKALQWMADPDENPTTSDAVRIINNSWNVDGEFSKLNPEEEPFCIALDNLSRLGVIPVFAAGNDGPSNSTIKLPAACPQALSVGATDNNDKIADFSSRGPVRWKSKSLTKPELSAPGVGIYSADLKNSYRTRSGTSMAAPHVVGALALLVQQYPYLNNEEIIEKLLRNADDLGPQGPDTTYGVGRMNIYSSVSK